MTPLEQAIFAAAWVQYGPGGSPTSRKVEAAKAVADYRAAFGLSGAFVPHVLRELEHDQERDPD